MTCIVGIVRAGRVYLGGDAAASDGWAVQASRRPKVFQQGPLVIGYTDSFRMGDLLRYRFSPPPQQDNQTDESYLAGDFIDAVRACFKAGGFAERKEERESGGSFLVGYRGGLYAIAADYQVLAPAEGYDAIGSGYLVALGVLHCTQDGWLPRNRITMALEAACAHTAAVRPPFTIIESE